MIDQRCKQSFDRQGLMRLLGAELLEARDGRAVIEVPFRDDLTQQHGYFHAGVVSSIADNAAGYAAYSVMPPDSSVMTVEFKINFLNPASGRRLRAEGQARKAGRTLVVASATVFSIDGDKSTPCAEFLGTMIALHNIGDEDRRSR